MSASTPRTSLAAPRDERRRILGGMAGAALATLGLPGLARAQDERIRIGHLTPLTGFLGPMGEYGGLGARMAVDEINKAGGLLSRPLELLSEDSVNPATASTKAQRLFERDRVAGLVGEINSAAGLAISQVALRQQKIFINTGGNSDELRGKSCNRFMFHLECANSMYVRACGRALLAAGLVKGKRWFMLTADYAFGHDLSRVAQGFLAANGGSLAGEERVPTDATDFSAFLLKARQSRADVVISNLAGAQITNFMKQYVELGLKAPVAGFGFDTALAWGAGEDNFIGTWPIPWHHTVASPSAQAFTRSFVARHGKPPENMAWGDYMAVRILAQGMAEARSTDARKVIALYEKGMSFDLMKARPGHFRAHDHQLLQEMYTMTPRPRPGAGAGVRATPERWDFLVASAPVPGPAEPLDVLAPSKEENVCTMGA